MKVDPSRSAAARKAKSPWRYNPMCITARAIAVFAERDKISPRLCTAVNIADAFGLTVSELIGQTAPILSEQERRVIAALRGIK